MSNALDIIYAPFWICGVLSIYSLTLEGIVWKLMVSTVLICTICLVGLTVFDKSNLWFLTPIFGGSFLLFVLLALWYFRLQGDPFILSNDWRAASFYLIVLALVFLSVIAYKYYLSSREEKCREMCLVSDQEYAFTAPRIGVEECRCFTYSDYPSNGFKNY